MSLVQSLGCSDSVHPALLEVPVDSLGWEETLYFRVGSTAGGVKRGASDLLPPFSHY